MEVTIAVMIISGALIAVYSQQTDRGCDPVKYDIATYYGTNYIAPNGQILNPTNYWFTSYLNEKMTETFWGTDDNGNPVSASLSMNHPL